MRCKCAAACDLPPGSHWMLSPSPRGRSSLEPQVARPVGLLVTPTIFGRICNGDGRSNMMPTRACSSCGQAIPTHSSIWPYHPCPTTCSIVTMMSKSARLRPCKGGELLAFVIVNWISEKNSIFTTDLDTPYWARSEHSWHGASQGCCAMGTQVIQL